MEEVRLGLLGFQREVKGVRGKVLKREKEVAQWLAERKRVRRQIALWRGLLEWEERLGRLEARLMLADGSPPGRDQDPYEENRQVATESPR